MSLSLDSSDKLKPAILVFFLFLLIGSDVGRIKASVSEKAECVHCKVLQGERGGVVPILNMVFLQH